MKSLLPAIQGVISVVEGDSGYLNFPVNFSAMLTRDGLPPWSSFYDEPLKMKGLVARAAFDPSELARIEQTIKTSSPDQVLAMRIGIQKQIVEDMRDLGADPTLGSMSPDQLEALLASVDTKRELQHEVDFYLLSYTMLTQIHYYFSLLTFGRNICDLVADAKAGDDDAFCKVVRIDRTALFGIRYFRNRLIRAQVGSEPEFLKKLANAIQAKPLGAKYSHKMLMFVFAILEDEGLLYELPQEKLMDICEELGVYGHDYGVDDPASLRKLLNKYKKRTRRQNQI